MLGVVLHRSDYKEADRLMTVYTDVDGRIQAIAKGVRRLKAKLGGSLEPFCVLNIEVVGKSSIKTVKSAEIVHDFSGFHSNYEKVLSCSVAAEIIKYGTNDEEPNPEIFTLLIYFLESVNGISNSKISLLAFMLKFLSVNGSAFSFIECCNCSVLLKNGGVFKKGNLGIYCSRCMDSLFESSYSSTVIKLEKKDLKIMEILSTKEWSIVNALEVDEEVKRLAVAKNLVEIFIEKDLKSM